MSHARALLRRDALRRGAAVGRDRGRRSRRRLHAEYAGDDRRRARRRGDRRGLVVVLAGLRRRRACSIASARSSRGCWSPPTRYFYAGKTHRLLPRVARDRSSACRPSAHGRSFPTSTRRDRCRPAARRRCGTSSSAAALRRDFEFDAAAVRPSALHPLFVRHDRRAQVHRPRRRRHADPAPEGAPAALRHPAGRPRVLLHDLRLDDVELAGDGARVGGDAAAVRRLAVPSRRQRRCSTSPTRPA